MSNELQIVPGSFMDIASMSFEVAEKYCERISNASFVPTSFKGKPGDVMCAIQFGLELGLRPMQALQNIGVINGKPCIYGDAMIALCKSKADYEYMNESFDEATMTATCAVKRKGEPEVIHCFSQEMAKLAGLWDKAGPWKAYPKRMLQMRARGFALRDAFPHHLKGIISSEEAQDYAKKEHEINPRPAANHAERTIVQPVAVDMKKPCSVEQIEALNELLVTIYPDEEARHLKENEFCQFYHVNHLHEMTEHDMDIFIKSTRRRLEGVAVNV